MFGKIRRMGRIFKEDGRALIVAMDHCSFNGTNPGLECPGKTLEEIKEGGGDAVLVNFGVARKFERELSGLGYIARLDLPPTYMRKEHDSRLVFSAASALRLGADAVIINIGQGAGIEEKSFEGLAHTIEYCDTIGMPVCAETVPGGFDADSSFHALEHIAKGARIGNEIGCDFMKIRYVPGFEQIVKESFVPLVVLGGSRSENPKDFLQIVYDAVQSGASGIAAGRNVWGGGRTVQMVIALTAIIHKNANVDHAYDILMSK